MQSLKSILTVFLLLTSFQLHADAPPAEAYLIQPGDILRITVWKEEDLQREVVVRPDGEISFPLVGELAGAGQPVSGLRAQIEARLEKYIPDPVVSVDVGELRGNTVYVIGKVNRPGAFPVTRNVDVMQALSMAGGMGTYAAANKIRILRRQDGELRAIPFEYGEIEKGENLEQNIVLQPGDVVVVP